MVHGAVLKDEGVRFSCTLNGDQAQTWFEADAPDSDDTSLRLCIIGQLDSTVTHTLAITNQGGTLAVASFERVMSSTNLSNDEFECVLFILVRGLESLTWTRSSDLDDAAVQSPSEVSTSTNSSTSSTTATPTDDATPTSTQLAEPAKTGEPVITASNIDAGDAGSDGDLPAASQTTGTVEIPSEPTTGGSSSSSSMIAVFVVIAFLVVIGVVGGVVAWKKKRRGTGKGGNKGRYTVIHGTARRRSPSGYALTLLYLQSTVATTTTTKVAASTKLTALASLALVVAKRGTKWQAMSDVAMEPPRLADGEIAPPTFEGSHSQSSDLCAGQASLMSPVYFSGHGRGHGHAAKMQVSATGLKTGPQHRTPTSPSQPRSSTLSQL